MIIYLVDFHGHPAGTINVPDEIASSARAVHAWMAANGVKEFCGLRTIGTYGDRVKTYPDTSIAAKAR